MRATILTAKRARSLRKSMTLPEVVLWQAIRRGGLGGLRFRRQHPVGHYILDFYCPAARLAVEIDGSSHSNEKQVQHDQRRDRWLAMQGILVLRIGAANVLRDDDLEGTLRYIEHEASARVAAPSTAFGGPPPPLRG